MLKESRGNQDSKEYIMAGLGDHTDQWGMGPVGEFGTMEKGGISMNSVAAQTWENSTQ